MKEVLWRDWVRMNICLETIPLSKRVDAMNGKDMKDSKLAGYFLITFEVLGLQVDVVESDWKHSIYDSLKSRRKGLYRT